MRKRVRVGWIKDGVACYDIDSGKVIPGQCKVDTTLEDFDFGIQGAIESERVVLGIPLISAKKKFWRNAKQKSFKVKVTIEEVI